MCRRVGTRPPMLHRSVAFLLWVCSVPESSSRACMCVCECACEKRFLTNQYHCSGQDGLPHINSQGLSTSCCIIHNANCTVYGAHFSRQCVCVCVCMFRVCVCVRVCACWDERASVRWLDLRGRALICGLLGCDPANGSMERSIDASACF